MSDAPAELAMHPSLLKYVDLQTHQLVVEYFDLHVVRSPTPMQHAMAITLNPSKSVWVARVLVGRQDGLGPRGRRAFQRLFVQNAGKGEGLASGADGSRWPRSIRGTKRDLKILRSVRKWEQVESGFPEIC